MILKALSATTTDLLTGFLIVLALSLVLSVACVVLAVLGARATERHQRDLDRAISRELATLDQELPDYLRVTGGARRGPDSPVNGRAS